MRAKCVILGAVLSVTPVTVAHPGHDDSPDPGSPVYLALSVDPAAGTNVEIEVREGYRYITSTGLPTHPTGQFPNRSNPNSISPQQYHFRVSLAPKPNERPTEIRRGGCLGLR